MLDVAPAGIWGPLLILALLCLLVVGALVAVVIALVRRRR